MESRSILYSMAATATGIDGEPPSPYYDILLLGRTGQGKSTTGNKLVEIENQNAILRIHTELNNCDSAAGKTASFQTGDGPDSITTSCKVISNELSMIRVLDTPGFADTDKTSDVGVFKGNLNTFRSILRIQDHHALAFCRVLYFLPLRGPLERADGTLQEELKLMYGFLGEDVFKIMAIVATNRKKRSGKQDEFDDEDVEETKKVFMTALKKVMGERVIDKCPPILYLPFLENNVIIKVVSAPVIYEEPLTKPVMVPFSATTPSVELIRMAKLNNKGKKLRFLDRCTKCSAKLIYVETARGRMPVQIVVNEGGESEAILPYNDSRCHPILVPEHYTITKIIGGIAHVATLGVFVGIGKIRGRKVWPGFTNHDEHCACCRGPPNVEGCTKVGKNFNLQLKKGTESISTCHSTTLDKLQVDEEIQL